MNETHIGMRADAGKRGELGELLVESAEEVRRKKKQGLGKEIQPERKKIRNKGRGKSTQEPSKSFS